MINISPTSTVAYTAENVLFRISGDKTTWDGVEIYVGSGDADGIKWSNNQDILTVTASKAGEYELVVSYENFKTSLKIRVYLAEEFTEFSEKTPEPGDPEYGVYPRQRIFNHNMKLVYDQLTNTNAKVNQLMTLIGVVSSLAGIVLTLTQINKKIDDIDVSGGGYKKNEVPSSNKR